VSTSSSAEPRPRLAFAYHPHSFATLAIAEAAREICDMVWVIDTAMREVGSMARLLRRLGTVVDVTGLSLDEAAARVGEAEPDGILALNDGMLAWTAEIADRLGLLFASPQTAANLTDKHAQRRALRAGGLLVPGFWHVPAEGDAAGWDALAREAVFPAVVKPRQSEGSRNTLPVGSMDELRTLVAGISASSAADRSELVLEQYIADRPEHRGERFADYVSVESIVSAGRISHLAVNGRFPPTEPFRETGFFIPCALPADERAAVLEVATAAIEAVGVPVGCLHTEIKLTPDGPCVIEVNGRIGGGVDDMLRDAAGIPLMAIALRLALGEAIAFETLPETTAIAYLLLVHAPPTMRRIVAIDGLDELRADPVVDEVVLNRGPGMAVDWREGNNGNVFSVTGTVTDHGALVALWDRIYADVRIEGEREVVRSRSSS
jgi:biotin carboxylase